MAPPGLKRIGRLLSSNALPPPPPPPLPNHLRNQPNPGNENTPGTGSAAAAGSSRRSRVRSTSPAVRRSRSVSLFRRRGKNGDGNEDKNIPAPEEEGNDKSKKGRSRSTGPSRTATTTIRSSPSIRVPGSINNATPRVVAQHVTGGINSFHKRRQVRGDADNGDNGMNDDGYGEDAMNALNSSMESAYYSVRSRNSRDSAIRNAKYVGRNSAGRNNHAFSGAESSSVHGTYGYPHSTNSDTSSVRATYTSYGDREAATPSMRPFQTTHRAGTTTTSSHYSDASNSLIESNNGCNNFDNLDDSALLPPGVDNLNMRERILYKNEMYRHNQQKLGVADNYYSNPSSSDHGHTNRRDSNDMENNNSIRHRGGNGGNGDGGNKQHYYRVAKSPTHLSNKYSNSEERCVDYFISGSTDSRCESECDSGSGDSGDAVADKRANHNHKRGSHKGSQRRRKNNDNKGASSSKHQPGNNLGSPVGVDDFESINQFRDGRRRRHDSGKEVTKIRFARNSNPPPTAHRHSHRNQRSSHHHSQSPPNNKNSRKYIIAGEIIDEDDILTQSSQQDLDDDTYATGCYNDDDTRTYEGEDSPSLYDEDDTNTRASTNFSSTFEEVNDGENSTYCDTFASQEENDSVFDGMGNSGDDDECDRSKRYSPNHKKLDMPEPILRSSSTVGDNNKPCAASKRSTSKKRGSTARRVTIHSHRGRGEEDDLGSICLCPSFQEIQEEIMGTYKDATMSLNQVYNAFFIAPDDIDSVADKIRDAKVEVAEKFYKQLEEKKKIAQACSEEGEI